MERTVTIEPNGVLTIPEEYRQILGIATGDKVALRLKDQQLIMSLPQKTANQHRSGRKPLDMSKLWYGNIFRRAGV